MKPRIPLSVIMSAMLLLVPFAFSQQAIPLATASQATKAEKEKVKVHQLSNELEKLIKTVEDSTLPCQTRNSVVRRLRKLDDALLSGHLSGARAMALAWKQDAWSLEAARVLSPEVGSAVQVHLGGLADQIGTDWAVKPGPTRHWKPLPSCDTGVTGVGGSVADPFFDVKLFLKIMVGNVVGSLVHGLVHQLWPQGPDAATNLFQQMVDQSTYDLVANDLKGLGELMAGVSPQDPTSWNYQVGAWKDYCLDPDHGGSFDSYDCVAKARDSLWNKFGDLVTAFTGPGGRVRFQQNETTDYRLALLPLFAQFENLYLSLLSDGVLLHEYWKERKDLNKDWGDLDGDMAWLAMAQELNPANTDDVGVAYVDKIYNIGLGQQPSASQDGWNTRNTYIRNGIISVLDFRNIWKYMDPRAYPDGVPGGVKLTRMIYSDTTGYPTTTPALPSNVAGPLKEVSVWTRPIWENPNIDSYEAAPSSVQVTSPPLLGPAQSGAVEGDTAQPRNGTWGASVNYYNLSAIGPITWVKTESYRYDTQHHHVTSWIRFYWAKGGYSDQGFTCSHNSSDPGLDLCGGFHDFSYEGEILASVQVMGPYYWAWDTDHNVKGNIAGSVVFGFRYPDSFTPAGEVIGVGSGLCMRLPSFTDGTQAEIYTCNRPPSPDQIWSYDPGLQQLSVTNPAVNPADNPNNLQSKYCLDTAGAWRSPVVINACDDGALTYDASGNPVVSGQRWTIDAVGPGIAKITNVKSGLVLSGNYSVPYNGAQLVLYNYSGTGAQQWRASDPLTGEIRGIGSGRCVDVPDYSTTPGTQVQIYDCHGNAAQQWTYNPTDKELIYARAPSLCLEARSGGTTVGTAVQINTCTGAPEQKWTLHGDGSTISNDKSGLVLEVPNGNTGNNTLLQLNTANGGKGQQWSRTSSRGGALHSVNAGKCLDLPEWDNGTQAEIETCASPPSAAQTWTYHLIDQTFTVNGPSGPKCLDADGTADHARVVVNDCTGAASQQWSLDYGNKTITNVNTITDFNPYGLVLDVTGGGTSDGTTVQLTPLRVDNQGNLLPPTPSEQWVWSMD